VRAGLYLAVAVLLAVAGCSSSETEAETSPRVVDGIELVRMPPPALERCRAGKLVGRACPALVPSSLWGDRPDWSQQRGGFPFSGAFELSAGAEHAEPSLDRPPRFVHLLILGGDQAANPRFKWPPAADAVAVGDGLRRLHRAHALALGRRTWGGLEGELVLAPPFGAGGIAGNHLVFRWRKGSSYYAVTLHSWEPFTETVKVLRALIGSVPG
jgi:hypothetical protein